MLKKKNNNNKRILLISKYNDLSKIYYYNTRNNKKIYKIIPSPNFYFDPKRNRLRKILNRKMKRNILVNNYSILGFNNNNNNSKNISSLIKMKTGHIILQIPYLKLFILYKE